MRKIVKTNLKLSLLKIQTGQQLADLQKEKRLASAKILLHKMKADITISKEIFSDEKIFTIEATFN